MQKTMNLNQLVLGKEENPWNATEVRLSECQEGKHWLRQNKQTLRCTLWSETKELTVKFQIKVTKRVRKIKRQPFIFISIYFQMG